MISAGFKPKNTFNLTEMTSGNACLSVWSYLATHVKRLMNFWHTCVCLEMMFFCISALLLMYKCWRDHSLVEVCWNMLIELCITTNWALLGPSFAEIRDKRGCGDENSTQEKKQGTKLVSHLNWSSGEFHPKFWIFLTSALATAHFFH
jgi:hypothetical protein